MAQITVAAGRCWQYSKYIGRRSTAGNGFSQPIAVAAAPNGVLYVGNRTAVRISKVTIDEDFIGEYGRGGEDDGQFVWLTSVVVDQDENVYGADEWLNRITVFDKDGNLLRTWGEAGDGEGQLSGPSGMAFDTDGNLLVVNSFNSRVQKFTKEGKFISGFGAKGDGLGEMDLPWGIAVNNHGAIYVTDWNNHRVQKFSPEGEHLLTFGSGKVTGVSPDGGTPYVHATVGHVAVNPNDLNHPTGVAVDADGDVYVVDWMNERVVIFDADSKAISVLRGDATGLSKWAQMSMTANPDMNKAMQRIKNPEVQNYLRMPVACTFDQSNNRLIVCDTMRGRLQIYQKDPNYSDPQFNL